MFAGLEMHCISFRTLLLTILLVPWMIFVGVPFTELIIRQESKARTTNKL
ncbi:MAG TPA: hypothetical protein VKI61_02280 [Chitinophagaceae bacterium]|nr:hypothetical protein [Chitinophagaceae bacterium]